MTAGFSPRLSVAIWNSYKHFCCEDDVAGQRIVQPDLTLSITWMSSAWHIKVQ